MLLLRKNIILWSGGKDSTATIILAHLHNEPVHEIIFTEVMYDNIRGISGENPEHMQFIKKVATPIFESWGYRVTILHSNLDYLTLFYRIIHNPRKKEGNRGKHFGFPLGKMCSIRRDCKIRPAAMYLNQHYGREGFVKYLGICADEPKRLSSMHKNGGTSLLEKYGLTQEDTRNLCLSYGLLSPSYGCSKRGGCWMCPYSKPEENDFIKKQDPILWEEFVSLEDIDNLANNRWNPFGDTLRERDARLW